MPITLQNGAVAPVGSDPYNLTADLLKLAKSLNLPIIVSSASERDNLPDKYDGLTVIRTDQGGIQQVYTGGVWYGFRSASAGVNTPAVAAGASASIDITYPPGIFPGIPRTTFTPGSSRLTPSVINMTATGCRIVLDNNTNGAASTVLGVWHATYGII